ncbi:MAG TPA: PEGA domain-containing protein [Vicinamibacterales bacterium]|jgi:hypothetical protein|nr:PEGA domain-containing protein [Vicinamibacterales bacterium]
MTPKRFVFLLVFALAVASPAAAQSRGGHGVAVSRGAAVARPVAVPRGSVAVSHGHYGGYHYGSYYYRPYYPYYYHPYAHPYYSFLPHFSIGVGISAGYPVGWPSYGYAYAYPYGYAYPYPYPYPYSGYYYPSYPPPAPAPAPPPGNYSYGGSAPYPSSGYSSGYPEPGRTQPYNAPSNSVSVDPGSHSNSGGVSFEIDPPTASVFVDGKYMGTGAEFGPTTQPLSLTTGRHRVDIRAEGYQSVSFDADVTAGQVTPYKASLERR